MISTETINGAAVQITWELIERVDHDPEERYSYYIMEGTTTDGRMFSAGGALSCGELEKVEDIEEIF